MGIVLILAAIAGLVWFVVYVLRNWSNLQAGSDAARYLADCRRAGADPVTSYTLSEHDKREAVDLVAGVGSRQELRAISQAIKQIERDIRLPGDEGYDPAAFMHMVREHAVLRYAYRVADSQMEAGAGR